MEFGATSGSVSTPPRGGSVSWTGDLTFSAPDRATPGWGDEVASSTGWAAEYPDSENRETNFGCRDERLGLGDEASTSPVPSSLPVGFTFGDSATKGLAGPSCLAGRGVSELPPGKETGWTAPGGELLPSSGISPSPLPFCPLRVVTEIEAWASPRIDPNDSPNEDHRVEFSSISNSMAASKLISPVFAAHMRSSLRSCSKYFSMASSSAALPWRHTSAKALEAG